MLVRSCALQLKTRRSKDLIFKPSHEGFKPKCSMRYGETSIVNNVLQLWDRC